MNPYLLRGSREAEPPSGGVLRCCGGQAGDKNLPSNEVVGHHEGAACGAASRKIRARATGAALESYYRLTSVPTIN